MTKIFVSLAMLTLAVGCSDKLEDSGDSGSAIASQPDADADAQVKAEDTTGQEPPPLSKSDSLIPTKSNASVSGGVTFKP